MSQTQKETELIVIGSGAAGLAASITAAEKGVRVTLFEKQLALGGTSNFFSGIFAVQSDMQKAQYIAYTCDQAFRNFMEYNHWRINGALVRNMINRSAETIRWLEQYGVVFPEVTINMPDAPRTYHVVKGGGEAVIKALAGKAKQMGVSIKLGSPVRSILKSDKRPIGVVAEIEGQEAQVPCKAVVIASGGYANNKAWIKKYTGFDLDETVIPIGNVGKMGDGIRMALEMGGAAEGLGVLHIIRMGPCGPGFPFMNVVEAAAIQPMLWVDPRGVRFCDEGIAFYDTSTGNANARFKKGYTFCLFDDSIKQHFMEIGIDRGMGMGVLPGQKLTELDTQLQHLLALNSKELVGSDSIEGLAEKMEVNPETLQKTITEYNECCIKGRDEFFGKNFKYLRPLKGPRFYAVRARTGFLGTLGGIRINQRTEVVNEFDVSVPGLYAAGIDAGGIHADSYSMRDSSGGASAFALISGRMAGANAALYLKH